MSKFLIDEETMTMLNEVDDARFLELTFKAMTDDTLLTVELDVKSAWVLVNALQLCARHPALSSFLRDHIVDTGHVFQAAIEMTHPDAHELLEHGWNPAFDQ